MSKKILEEFIRWLFPPRCIGCRSVLASESYYFLCSKCFERVPFVKGRTCRYCGKRLLNNEEGEACVQCGSRKWSFERTYCPFEYTESIRKGIRDLKYRGRKANAEFFATAIEQAIIAQGMEDIDYITCIPSHKSKLRRRGYNPAELIAKALGQRLNLKVDAKVLEKTRETQSQSQLDRAERMVNIQGSFRVAKPERVVGKTILLVDDVLTTGSTVEECSRVLMAAGARKVLIGVAATGSRQRMRAY